jgi:Protein of unknown function (DUF3761)
MIRGLLVATAIAAAAAPAGAIGLATPPVTFITDCPLAFDETCTTPPPPPPGASALCCDCTYSFSQHHSGTCSHHDGVCKWLDQGT